MNRFPIFIGSVFLAFVAVSTATSASASDWTGAGDHSSLACSWAITPSGGLLASSFDTF